MPSLWARGVRGAVPSIPFSCFTAPSLLLPPLWILLPFSRVPVTNGRLNLGTWQGIWLCEHRNSGGARRLVVTVMGSPK